MRLSTLATAIASSFSFSMKWERTFSNSSAEIRTISSLVLLRTTVERERQLLPGESCDRSIGIRYNSCNR